MLLAGTLVGFLCYNFNPAKIFLGTAGSTFIGFTLATLAIISGGKIATAVLVLGFPILDSLAVIIRRSASGGLPWEADATHLHHRLLNRGFSTRQTVLTLYAVSAAFGGLALLAGTTGYKALAFVGVAFLMGVVLWRLAAPKAPAKSS
jgi:UDP-N-acetylmuramyl pentapeptide phosphotransferase/UDP-N-acetylglucosamine-1-phosphate transferase